MAENMLGLFRIGTKFHICGKDSPVCTVKDILTTRNSAGEIVDIRYIAFSESVGNIVAYYTVTTATISDGLIE